MVLCFSSLVKTYKTNQSSKNFLTLPIKADVNGFCISTQEDWIKEPFELPGNLSAVTYLRILELTGVLEWSSETSKKCTS